MNFIINEIKFNFLITIELYYTSAHGSGRRYYILLLKFLSFFTRDSVAIARICHGNIIPSVRLSVPLSVTRVDQSKTVEARITQVSPYSSPIPLVFRG